MRWALTLEYSGIGFNGWQLQPDRPSVQQALETAIASISGQPVRVVAAGRTDTGVHATCQVVHFDTAIERRQNAWLRGVNAFLPESVAVLDARPVSDEFHARFSARSRRYRYLLLNRATRPGILAGRIGWYHAALDCHLMQQAAHSVLGEHDFSAFRAAECQAKTPVKHLHSLQVTRLGDVVTFDLHANAFLHHMVRNLIGSLIYVGNGRHSVEWLLEVLAKRERAMAAPTFMADGLYLTGVEYPESFGVGGYRPPLLTL